MLKKDTRHTLTKSERLTSRKLIEKLFNYGKSFSSFPFVVWYLPLDDSPAHQVLFTVSKKNYKRAVDRNRLKRQMREAYRLSKEIISGSTQKFAIAYIYSFREMLPSKDLETKLIAAQNRLQKELITK